MSEKMTDILTRYCLAMGLVADCEAWLFPGNDNTNHIPDNSVKNRFRYILKDNDIELKNRKKHERGPCLHCMRHVFAFKSFKQTEILGMSLSDSVPFFLYMDIVAKHIPADKDGVRIAELDEQTFKDKWWSHTPITDFWRVDAGTAKRLETPF